MSLGDRPVTWHRDDLTVTTDRAIIPVDAALALLRPTFWGTEMPREQLERAIENSVTFGLLDGSRLVGFGRVVSDLATYAYWTDVVIAEELRGRGYGECLARCMLEHPELQGLRRVSLLTRDAERFYGRLLFTSDLAGLTYLERRPEKR
ncbi:MAG: GNAT family N-acetyltransferase [Gemmatimonadales bacterium]